MAKSDQRFTICLSEDLLAIEAHLMESERYRSHSEAYASFLRHWAISQQPHHLTGGWANLSPAQRDEIDADLLKLVRSGTAKKGSWLKKLVYDTIKAVCGADAKSPTVEQIMIKLPAAARTALHEE